MLHKIHKVNNPGRPVVSLVNSHTEKLSVYHVDEFFRPIAEKLPSYIQDTTHFIKRIRVLGRLPEKCYRKWSNKRRGRLLNFKGPRGGGGGV